MADNKTLLTVSGLRKYEEELYDLKVNRRADVAQKIKVAREQGDLSENADYDAAKDEQTEIERRIEELENILKNAEVVQDSDIDPNRINVGCEVVLYDISFEEEVTYLIVGTTEADILKGRISNESPVGAALMGHKAGDIIEVALGDGEVDQYRILSTRKVD